MYVFTTRADTIMGVTFCAVAPEHPIATQAALSNPALAAFIEAMQARRHHRSRAGGTQRKEGMATGLFVTHPLTASRFLCGSATTC